MQDEKTWLNDEQYLDDAFEQSGDDLSQQKYGQLKDVDKVVDLKTEKIIDKKELPPFEQIQLAAKESGTTLRKPNSGCRHCYGRGYTGKNLTGEPIACTCIFPARTGRQIQQETAMLNYMQAMKKKQKSLQKSVVNKTSVMLKNEFEKRVQKVPEETNVPA